MACPREISCAFPARHPARRRCAFLTYTQYSRSERPDDDGCRARHTGKFHLLSRHSEAAVSSLEAALRLEPDLHAARYFLGLARLAQGNPAEARRQLQLVPAGTEYAPAAARVLATRPGGRGRGAGS